MFSPFYIILKIEHPGIDLNNIDYDLIKKLKEKYQFEEAEILKESINLKHGHNILDCVFEENTILISTTGTDGTIANEIIDLAFSEFNLEYIIVNKFEFPSMVKFNDVKTIANINLKERDLIKFDYEFIIALEENEKIVFRMLHDKQFKVDFVSANLSSSERLDSSQKFKEFFDRKHREIHDITNDIFCTQDNLEFLSIEVTQDE
ncbi:hypothetical protein D3C74_262670 [compost metagenome]